MLADRGHRDVGSQREQPHADGKQDRAKDESKQRARRHRNKRETNDEHYRRDRQDRFQSLFHLCEENRVIQSKSFQHPSEQSHKRRPDKLVIGSLSFRRDRKAAPEPGWAAAENHSGSADRETSCVEYNILLNIRHTDDNRLNLHYFAIIIHRSANT
ncbi:hypothetical protein SDC9_140721 [bioreactor metagenome]|uniref:Uncharacterized protein n=1 Tax=bioreactor metagenome TaxID=1076179 RepID=A0A645DW80_9ZZZZ